VKRTAIEFVMKFKAELRLCTEYNIRAKLEWVFAVCHCGRCAGAAGGRLGDVVLLIFIVYDLLKLFAFTEVSCVAYIGRRSSDPDANSYDTG
jgi:hypothetical protein